MEILNSSFGSLRLGNNGVISPDLETNAKMYNALEPALQDIQKAISLPEHERTQHNAVIHEVLDIITKELKAVDKLFKNIYQKTLYGGSYYDGLKLNSADEYDIDLALKLPKETNPFLKASDIAGFVQIHVDLESLKKNPKYDEFRAMERLVDAHNNLLTEQFRDWFEGVLNKAKNNLTKNGSKYKFDLCKSGPAFTLKLHINNKLVSVDLVPSLIFGAEKWPGSPFRGNVTRNTEFLVVPKTPVGSSRYNISWRLSFQEQEKLIINGKCGLKDTIRLLKLLRNHQMQETSFPSYYLKTVMMWMSECVNEAFWKNSRSYIFMMGLKYFCTLLENGKLPYYWNAEYNLLSGKKAITLENWSKRMNKIFKNLEKCNNKADVLKNFGLEKLLLKVGEEQNQTSTAIVHNSGDSRCNIS